MTAGFVSKDGNVPFPRTTQEWMAKKNPLTGDFFTVKEAEHKVAQDVFGHDYQTDSRGSPIERGKGSALQPTAQHHQAIEIEQSARRSRQGWHPGLEGAFDPRIQAEIERQVAERLAAMRKPKAKRKAKGKTASVAEDVQ